VNKYITKSSWKKIIIIINPCHPSPTLNVAKIAIFPNKYVY
jgi:hypothetical protein